MASKSEPRPLDAAVSALQERFHPIVVVLFGSHASGRESGASDVDLGILIGGQRPDPFTLASARTDLEALLGRDVDLIVLDDASPVVRMDILRNHRVLLNRDPECFEALIVRTLREYFDLKRVREPIERALLSQSRS